MSNTTVDFPGQARWDTLVTSAILGVDRQPPAAYLTDHPLSAWVAKWADRPTATRLLREAFVLDRALAAAQRPGGTSVTEAPDTSPIKASDQPMAPVAAPTRHPAMLDLWRRWRAMGDQEACMIWVEAAAPQGITVPDEDLPWLWAQGERNTAIRPHLAAVSGPMGAWLLQRPNHPWPYMVRHVQRRAPEAVLNDPASEPEERSGAFQAWAPQDPAAAMAWLQDAWDGEKAEFRTVALLVLRPHRAAHLDEAWWTKRLTDRSRNVRTAALAALWADPATVLAQQENAITQACFVRTPAGKWSKLFGGQGSMELVLPAEGTPEDEKRGLDIDPGHRKVGRQAWMLHERVRRTHPDQFALWDGLEWDQRLEWARHTDEANLLIEAWTDAAVTFQHHDLARALLKVPQAGHRADVAAVLPVHERRALAEAMLLGPKGQVKLDAFQVVRNWPDVWTETLTTAVGRSIAWSIDRHGHLQPWGEAHTLMQLGHPKAARALLDGLKSSPMASTATASGVIPYQEMERHWGAALDRRLALHDALQAVMDRC